MGLHGPIDLDEHFLHGVVHFVAEPLKVQDASHLRRVPAKELGACLWLLVAKALDEAVREFFDDLPPKGTPAPAGPFAAPGRGKYSAGVRRRRTTARRRRRAAAAAVGPCRSARQAVGAWRSKPMRRTSSTSS